ncbi:lipopolysaccharide biosynthesis protein [Chryseobacterium vietnamense]|uniref:lipopolysaccharide biosynthesis protein n=1 Tax=Chryseobacterium vietnamense TaxID=866785 RepID=UPI00286D61B9|nr:oligosaccharide flippase family protein [Chryseobacterium vietnamense]
MPINNLILRLKEMLSSDFRKNLLVMIGGSFFAQLIPILFSFLLTRIYTPEDFGVFSNFSAVLSFLLVFMMLKYEMAVILPKKDSVAANLIVLCLGIGVFFFALSSVIIYLFDKFIYLAFNFESRNNFLVYIPLAGLLFSSFNLLNEWFVRKKYFQNLIKNKIINNSSIAGISALLPQVNILSLGLIKGQIFGQVLSVVSGFYIVLKKDKASFKNIDKRVMKKLFFKYINFAKFNIPGQLINTLSVQIVIFYLTSQFGFKVVGFYALTDRFLGVPLSFIGNAVKDVFKQKAAEDYRNNGECSGIYKKTTLLLIACALPPFIILFIFAPDLFAFFFGSQWKDSGIFAQILCVMYLLSFITMPTGWLFVIAEKQKFDFLWQMLFLIFTVASLGLGYILFKGDVVYTLLLLSVGRSITYLIQMVMTYRLAIGKV